MLAPDLSVVVMAFNEAECLPVQLERTVDFLEAHAGDWQIVVVDDGSADRTGEIADDWAARHPGRIDVVHHPVNRGMGAAIRSGYGAARRPWVTQLPGDGQIEPRSLLTFFEHLDESRPGGAVDIVLSVYRRRDDGLHRTLLSKSYQGLVRLLLGQRGDYTAIMVFRRSLLDEVGELRSDTFFVNMELPILALRRGARHALVEIEAVPRLHGSSKVANLRRITRVLREMVAMRLRR